MTTSLKERYEARQQLMAEGFMDYFKSGSANIQKFNNTIAGLKKLAQTYKLQALSNALQKAEGEFQTVVMAQQSGQKADQNKATSLSQAVTFVSTMASFMDTLKNITMQLPSIQNAMKDKQNGQQPLSQMLGADVNKFGQLISNQFNKAGGGVLKTIGRIFRGGGGQNAQTVLQKYGIDGTTMANDLLQMTPAEFEKFTQASATTPSFELTTNAQPSTAPANSAGAATPAQPQGQAQAPTQPTTTATQTAPAAQPAAQPAQTAGNTQQAAHPQAYDYIKKNVAGLTPDQKKELLTLLQQQAAQQPANAQQIQPQPIKNIGGP